MIVDFTIENFRSFKDKQTFSLVSDSDRKRLSDNYVSHLDNICILKTAAIYGSNASGKSNLCLAFEVLESLISDSGEWKEDDEIELYQPFRFDSETIDADTIFDIEFYLDQKRFNYEIRYNQYAITYERLDYYPSSRVANLFLRESSDEWENVKFGSHYKGGRRQVAFFPNNAYLSKAGNSADTPPIIRDVYNYFRRSLLTLTNGRQIRNFNWHTKEKLCSVMASFISNIDIGVTRFSTHVNTERLDAFNEFIKQHELPSPPKDLRTSISGALEIEFSHIGSDGKEYTLDFEQESEGTQRFFEMLPVIINLISEGDVLVIDELERNFHPHLAELIIRLFIDPDINTKNAQLIFTTHDLSLMDPEKMRKDQVWFVEKSVDGSKIHSLENFDSSSLKSTSPFSKWYNEGRLGAIPEINYSAIAKLFKDPIVDAKEKE